MSTRTIRIGLLSTIALAVVAGMWAMQNRNDIPIPFFQNGNTSLRGQLTVIGKKNDTYDVVRATFPQGTETETLGENKIYLLRVPDDQTIVPVALDAALTVSGSHVLNYFGYKYLSVDAASEKAARNDPSFAAQFPGTFFASQKARDEDPGIVAFEQLHSPLSMSATTGATAVQFERNALYIIIVNESRPVRFSIHPPVCGDGQAVSPVEQCDDGDLTPGNGCSDMCQIEPGYTCIGTTPSVCTPSTSLAGSGTLTIAVRTLPATKSGSGGNLSIPLLAFQATASGDEITMNRLSFKAEVGSLSSLANYILWEDITGDGVVDRPVSKVTSQDQGLLTFAPAAWTGAVIGSGSTIVYELRADVPDTLSGTTIKVAFDTVASDYVAATQFHDSDPVIGIETDGVCADTCAISVTTQAATLWTFKGCPDGLTQAPETCDDNNAIGGDGCSAVCAVEGGYSCIGEPSVCTPD